MKGHPCTSMGKHGYPVMSMDTNGSPCVSIGRRMPAILLVANCLPPHSGAFQQDRYFLVRIFANLGLFRRVRSRQSEGSAFVPLARPPPPDSLSYGSIGSPGRGGGMRSRGCAGILVLYFQMSFGMNCGLLGTDLQAVETSRDNVRVVWSLRDSSSKFQIARIAFSRVSRVSVRRNSAN